MDNNNGTAIAKYARHRMTEQNKNALQIAVGDTGSGKSTGSAMFSGQVDDTFFDDMERVVFNPRDFMHKFPTMRTGEALMYEEAGITLAARDFQKRLNKMVGAINQTFRHRNLCVTYNVPSMKFVEMQIRDLMHCIFHMRWIDFKQEVSYADCWKVDHDPLYGTTTLTHYEFETWDGGRHAIDRVGFGLPPKKWLTEYEKMKTDFTTELYDKFEQELEDEANRVDPKLIKQRENQAQALLNMLPYIKQHHTWNEVENWASVSARTMQRWLEAESSVA